MKKPKERIFMWYKVRELDQKGLSKSQISLDLSLDRGTVRKYLLMSEDDFQKLIECGRHLPKKLNGYFDYVRKELQKHPLLSDRMSCSRFEANQFRFFMHSAAYVLLHALRDKMLRGTEYANATMKTIRLRLIKVAEYVKEMKTRVKIELPRQFPDMVVMAHCLGNFSGLRC